MMRRRAWLLLLTVLPFLPSARGASEEPYDRLKEVAGWALEFARSVPALADPTPLDPQQGKARR